MPYPQQPHHPHYYPQQPMHPSHGPPPQQPPHHGPPHHQPHIMQPGPQQPHQAPAGYYHQPMQHPSYPQPPPPQQSMPPPNPYMQYSPQPHPHYYQQPMQQGPPPPPPHGPQAPHPHSGPPPPHHQQHMLGPGPQQPHQPSYYHQPMQHPGYGQPLPPPHGPQQSMPPPSPYIQYSQPHPHYYQQPMQQGPPPHGPQVPHPHPGPPPPHHQQHMMPPGPQQQHQPNYYHQPMQHPAYPPLPHSHPPPPAPPSHPVASVPSPAVVVASQPPPPPHQPSPHQPLSLPPPPPSPHHPSSRAHTPQHPPSSQTPTKAIPPPGSTPASPSTVPKAEKKEITFPKNSVEATKPAATKRRKFTSKDVTDIEAWRILMCLKSGLLAESSWAIDVLSILLNDDSTSLYFGLQHMPGMLEAILEHFKCCLNVIFKDMGIKNTTLKPELGKPVNYSHWQEGNGEDTSHIQVYFEPHNFIETSRRCICISTVLRNLSFIPGNDVEMSKHAGLLLILGRVLMYKPDDTIYNELDSPPNEWHLLSSLREDTLVIISNISSSLDLSPYNDKINLDLLKGLLHWACCSSTYALDPFPPPSMVSPQRLALESLAKLSIIEGNVDLILATPPWTRVEKLFEVLTNMLNMNEDQTIREFSLVLLSNLVAADSGIARKVALTGYAIARLVSFLETSIADPETYATTQDMLRRAALTLKSLSQLVDNHPLFAHYQQRLLNLVMSKRLDQEVVPIIADVIFEISLSY